MKNQWNKDDETASTNTYIIDVLQNNSDLNEKISDFDS